MTGGYRHRLRNGGRQGQRRGQALVCGVMFALCCSVPLRCSAATESGAPPSVPPESVILAQLTAPDVAAALRAGKTTIIIPTGGTEQNGPHLPLGKHNIIVAATAERIAVRLGNALVAPVIAYVPEGQITPPTGHMRFAGTISVRATTFAALLTDAAESFRQHGFRLIVLLGDSGGNQATQIAVADRLNRRWASLGESARVLAVTDYYAANRQDDTLRHAGFSPDAIGQHAGMRDTAELLVLAPGLVRRADFRPGSTDAGFDGDPRLATAAMGAELLQHKVDAAVAQIRAGPPRVAPLHGVTGWLARFRLSVSDSLPSD